MKIKLVNYIDGEARFVMEELPTKSFCIKLKSTTTIGQVTDELKAMLPKEDTTEQTFNDLDLKSLEGTDI